MKHKLAYDTDSGYEVMLRYALKATKEMPQNILSNEEPFLRKESRTSKFGQKNRRGVEFESKTIETTIRNTIYINFYLDSM